MPNEVIFDVETKKLFSDVSSRDPGQLGVSIVSAYIRQLDDDLRETKGEMKSFWEDDFEQMWPLFQQADRLIGFNSLGFDVPALQPYANIDLSKLANFDILEKIRQVNGYRVGLSVLARETLGHTKTDQGTNAVVYWAKGDQQSLAKLQEYCEADVATTRDLYDYIMRHQSVKFKNKWNNLVEIELDFSYQANDNNEQQIGLF